MRIAYLAAAAALSLAPVAANATILTFDIAGGATDHENMPQTYGDNVAAILDGLGHSYGVGAEGFTPNVTVSYGAAGEDPALWTTGYGDLTNVMINDADGDTTMTTRLTAAAGYVVDLYAFDLAWYFNENQSVQGFTVRDVGSNTVLYTQAAFSLSGFTHNTFNFTGVSGRDLEIVVNLGGLGGESDDVGFDNLRFGQSAAVPEPATWAMMLLGFVSAGAVLRSGRRRAAA